MKRRSSRKSYESTLVNEEEDYIANTYHSPKPMLSIDAKIFPILHSICLIVGFFLPLLIACRYHFKSVVKNQFHSYPKEYVPTVSAVVGDWFPERNIFDLAMAAAAFPRFVLLILTYVKSKNNKSLAVLGFIRTVFAGLWIYVPSGDNNQIHEISIIAYVITSILYMFACAPMVSKTKHLKTGFAWTLVVSLIALTYQFLRHKILAVAGAYSIYAIIEWPMIIVDGGFDFVTFLDVRSISIKIIDETPIEYYSQSAAAQSENGREEWNDLFPKYLITLKNTVVDTYLAMLFWSLFASVPITIWYFPLWDMGLSGYEVAVLGCTIPSILAFKSVRDWVARNRNMVYLSSLLSLLSYNIDGKVLRLGCVTFNLITHFMASFVGWIDSDAQTSKKEVLTTAFGLVMYQIMRMANYTNDPLWPVMKESTGGWQVGGALFLCLSIIDRIFFRRFQDRKSLSPSEGKGYISAGHFEKDHPVQEVSMKSAPLALGLGSIVSLIHILFMDSSTILRYTNEGYPDAGFSPMFGGSLVICSTLFGFYLSQFSSIALSFQTFSIAFASLIPFYASSTWISFPAGLILVTYISSIFPHSIGTSFKNARFGRVVFFGMIVYVVFALASVWTVAYAFLPGGEYLRERSFHVFVAQFMCILYALIEWKKADRFSSQVVQNSNMGLDTFFKNSALILTSFLALSVCYRYNRQAPIIPNDYQNKEVMTMAIWTIHFGLDNDMYFSHTRMRDIIETLKVDVIGFLESDGSRPVMGNRDVTQQIAEELGFYSDYGPSGKKHTWGCAMISKFPILKSTHLLLPSPVGELACAIHATLDVFGRPVDVIVSHNGQEEDPLDRKLQTETLASVMKTSSLDYEKQGKGLAKLHPFVFLGYVVTLPFQDLHVKLMEEGNHVRDSDYTDNDRWCQYILYRGLQRIGYARVSHGDITDTEIQVGKFRFMKEDGNGNNGFLGKTSSGEIDWDKEVNEEEVPDHFKFPKQLYGKGWNGHRYHVFDKPKYYL